MALFCAGGILGALVELLLAHLAGTKDVRRINPFTGQPNAVGVRVFPAKHWPSMSLAIACAAMSLLCIMLCILLVRKRGGLHKPKSLRRAFKRQSSVVLTVGSFYVGTVVAAAVRFYLGGISVGTFATGSAPIVAGILVGVIVAGIDDNGRFPWHRQLALMYWLMGSVATAIGTIPAPSGWFWGACFLVIFGGLAASVCLTIDIVVNRPARPVAESTSRPAATS
jgi:hypothetical protein